MKTVHVVFKTHFDYGYTDFAELVLRRYREKFIPQAIRLAEELRQRGGPERFVWTTGSLLIYDYLEWAGRKERRRMEQAIAAGDIAWHALSCTTHTELMDPSLFRFGLSLAQELDRRFGRRTIAAKMTDVTGHCRAVVPLLAEAGVKFLHIGVNPACSPPAVPPIFRWRAPDGSEIIVAYSADYGSPFRGKAKDLEHALVFAHTGDNLGAPSMAKILADFQEWREAHRGAKVVASTLDAYAKGILPHREDFPVVTAEIADPWIYGTGSDPRKVGEYRALCRLRLGWEQKGFAKKFPAAFRRCSLSLAKVAEHTWGMDEKTHLADYVNYSAADFARARRRDIVPDSAVPGKFEPYGHYRQASRNFDGSPRARRFSIFAASWDEQRGYVCEAVKALAGTPMADDARRALQALRPARPKLRRFERVEARQLKTAGQFEVKFDAKDGSLIHLRAQGGGHAWCDSAHPLARFRYQTFSQADFDRYVREFAVNLDRHAHWAIPDLAKPGMDDARPKSRHAFFPPARAEFHVRHGDEADEVLVLLGMPETICRSAGAPREVVLRYRFPRHEPAFALELSWFDKTATRLPEAAWLSFTPRVSRPGAWRMEKMGEWFSPLEVCSRGNRYLHGIGRAIEHAGPEGTLVIESTEAHLVAPGRPRLLRFNDEPPPLAEGMHFNLHNNLYGTNFPMWYDDDTLFRFNVRIEPARKPLKKKVQTRRATTRLKK